MGNQYFNWDLADPICVDTLPASTLCYSGEMFRRYRGCECPGENGAWNNGCSFPFDVKLTAFGNTYLSCKDGDNYQYDTYSHKYWETSIVDIEQQRNTNCIRVCDVYNPTDKYFRLNREHGAVCMEDFKACGDEDIKSEKMHRCINCLVRPDGFDGYIYEEESCRKKCEPSRLYKCDGHVQCCAEWPSRFSITDAKVYDKQSQKYYCNFEFTVLNDFQNMARNAFYLDDPDVENIWNEKRNPGQHDIDTRLSHFGLTHDSFFIKQVKSSDNTDFIFPYTIKGGIFQGSGATRLEKFYITPLNRTDTIEWGQQIFNFKIELDDTRLLAMPLGDVDQYDYIELMDNGMLKSDCTWAEAPPPEGFPGEIPKTPEKIIDPIVAITPPKPKPLPPPVIVEVVPDSIDIFVTAYRKRLENIFIDCRVDLADIPYNYQYNKTEFDQFRDTAKNDTSLMHMFLSKYWKQMVDISIYTNSTLRPRNLTESNTVIDKQGNETYYVSHWDAFDFNYEVYKWSKQILKAQIIYNETTRAYFPFSKLVVFVNYTDNGINFLYGNRTIDVDLISQGVTSEYADILGSVTQWFVTCLILIGPFLAVLSSWLTHSIWRFLACIAYYKLLLMYPIYYTDNFMRIFEMFISTYEGFFSKSIKSAFDAKNFYMAYGFFTKNYYYEFSRVYMYSSGFMILILILLKIYYIAIFNSTFTRRNIFFNSKLEKHNRYYMKTIRNKLIAISFAYYHINFFGVCLNVCLTFINPAVTNIGAGFLGAIDVYLAITDLSFAIYFEWWLWTWISKKNDSKLIHYINDEIEVIL